MSFRSVFPYFATLAVVALLFGIFAFRPTPFIGITPEAMADSLSGELASGAPECEEVGDDAWRCQVIEPGGNDGGVTPGYDIEINDFGCWTATPFNERPQVGVPRELTACLTLLNH